MQDSRHSTGLKAAKWGLLIWVRQNACRQAFHAIQRSLLERSVVCTVDGFGVVVVDLSIHCLVIQHSNVVCDQMDGTVGDTMS